MIRNGTIIVCIVCVLMTTGCVSQNLPSNTSGSTTNTPVVTEIPTQCPTESGNETPYIIINPIGEHFKDTTFEINGTSNFEIHEPLYYSIDRGGALIAIPGNRPSQYDNGAVNISYGEILNTTGVYNGQNWSLSLNTSGSEFEYGLLFILNVSTSNNTIYNSSSFLLNSRLKETNK